MKNGASELQMLTQSKKNKRILSLVNPKRLNFSQVVNFDTEERRWHAKMT